MTLQQYLLGRDYQAFADEMKVDISTVYRWCNGSMKPRPSQINKIEELTGGEVTYYDFYPKLEGSSARLFFSSGIIFGDPPLNKPLRMCYICSHKLLSMSQELERLYARILFNYEIADGTIGREIVYIYNRESFEQLNIQRQKWDNSQFISVGDELTLEGRRCKVVRINFKLEPMLYKMDHGKGVNLLSPTDPTDFNCQIGVFVKRID